MLQLSKRIENLRSSPVREILSVIQQPGMISFAGGLPAPDAIPELSLETFPASLLQYGESEGELELRELIAKQMCDEGLECSPNQVVVLSGSQQGIDLVAKLFIDAGSQVAMQAPTYLAAIQVFQLFGADFCPFSISGDNVALAHVAPRLLYTVPTFQNPSGQCYNEADRRCLASFCEAEGVPLLEDDPYRELSFENCYKRPVCGLMKGGTWIYLGSFSKCFAPGLRVGFMVCSEDILIPIRRLKQAADLHSCRLSQWLAAQFLKDSMRVAKMDSLREFYRERRDSFNRSLIEHFSALATWKKPSGGLFYWLRLNQRRDLDAVLKEALAQKVAFMPGDHFFGSQDMRTEGRYMRLNFSHVNPELADEGLAKLAAIVANGRAVG